MRALLISVLVAGGLTGCASWTNHTPDLADVKVGDCLKLGGTADDPQATEAACGSAASNFKVVATAADRSECPADVDSFYSTHNAMNGSTSTLCLDIDWVLGGCMSVDPQHRSDPVRVDCNDASVPHRQRATQILKDLDPPVGVDQCASGVGYAYSQRRFAVCVEDVVSGARG
ncbi:hypothetical protein MKUB_17640 [Mycobacterium kubicae]|uniref:Lipoprotein LppU n=1 Tax=Mycobacterium kubicae TaxID=120959 RepID=A0AAX1JGU1_9MYCO|nr:hypothetical protein [Mycobacterium kubicae]MCV7097022.1 hypothetical protein [Mycobacterium kubicae]OBF22850.1 hypothetical protein A5725_11620 [Mycobacterium kubicae]OBK47327.1 hypothetical protein A5657_02480 [Mycobacterium kubicae]ORV98723.1 hypothetical protein AWC13_12980 [Mycobacterium kubicae]QNI11440.1 hypothetical protein GAN18_09635 [Mycobacterium kubicae]